ncbi:GPR1/FUN34/YaaH family transporter [Actinokineospora sp.]|uniref:GPR1/FUN34/YaaH family transporter n=1 Tax=Actinokineospora sp. TaxID=1872133 RepID=UPI004037AD76
MSVDHDAASAPAAPAPNPGILGLATFLPGGITLGLWLVGYLDTAALGGGMIPAVTFSSGLFLLIACVWASRVGASAVAGIFGTFSAFWLSFGFLLMGLINGWFGISTDAAVSAGQVQNVQATYVLSFLIVFVLVTLATLRLPLAFTLGFVFVDITFAMVLVFVLTGNTTYAVIGGIADFAFCAVFAYILLDAITQDLGGKAKPLGNPITK